jgi:hypothetical protein
MTYASVRRALAKACAANPPGRWASVADVRRADPSLTADEVVAEMGAMHDNGEATVSGWSINRTARYDGAVAILSDGTAYPIVWASNRRALGVGVAEVDIVDLSKLYIDTGVGGQ